MLIPSNNFVKLAIGAGHAVRVDLANQLFYPIAVDINNPSQPLAGGSVGNRSGRAVTLGSAGVGGNTAAYGADFSSLTGDPLSVVKINTANGPLFTLAKYDGTGIITIEDPTLGANPYASIPRYVVKADGTIFDCLEARGQDTETAPNTYSNLRHWEFAADGAGTYTVAGGYVPGGIFGTPSSITENHYTRAVGKVSFRAKSGAASAVIQEQIQRTQSGIDTMSRMLRAFHDEAKGPFSNIVIK
ncbi:hypothetical protein COW36_14905 [bacterium (Candidatus Blackallbacteria) CG17_big_fil_post_rev_8_21_14_2_50_48_46]|uniref:Uncharacterized protein n=1 Tax=bacterium (Candidatus Blackallbacteria) CG17_big_fil_post_rev_8_21_14_2_50_48_46 TaxID=2014261 RepID=A0A2M7G2H7_9BACT|nr:MAG: hypothetical protein COW64_11645 [bacterium (Candidatus Blackallbacteria) CG18_big_fil_WC_8_21_14_2_50_49_26]PIW16000.1 MAG: hypothetical protein COW36_14905 [bacterium (Candidatus Blackallbacteria) CG17_big_fil_post_rev_8_21_14_2_50_48_46]PIW50412.1 MAG: hypothetical protein COW20_02620 [bacterium (Candidatus Blackallbacteria) CG13_big_fil_rev_8_21_14_2_50_49_14]